MKTDPEPWECVSWDIMLWRSVLMEYGVDRAARQELFLLAQMGMRGALHANAIIGKLMKKKADKDDLRNPSGFVHAAYLKARHYIQNTNPCFSEFSAPDCFSHI